MSHYPHQLNQIIIDEFESFLKNRFTDSPKFVSDAKIDEDSCISARIALTGENIKGFLAVNASRNTLLQCHPERRYGDEITEEDLKDWIGEIVNRALGNMKNKLLEYNLQTALNPPIHSTDAFNGDGEIAGPVAEYIFSNGKEIISVRFQADIAPSVEFDKTA